MFVYKIYLNKNKKQKKRTTESKILHSNSLSCELMFLYQKKLKEI